MADALPVVGYASGPRSRRWSRLCLAAGAMVFASPVVSGTLLYLADRNVLPQHFLCCNHPEVSVLVFVAFPLCASAAGCAGTVGAIRHRASLGSIAVAVVAVGLGLVLAAAGGVLCRALKM